LPPNCDAFLGRLLVLAGDSMLRMGVALVLGVGDSKVRGPGLLLREPGLMYIGQAVGPWSWLAGGHWKLPPAFLGLLEVVTTSSVAATFIRAWVWARPASMGALLVERGAGEEKFLGPTGDSIRLFSVLEGLLVIMGLLRPPLVFIFGA